ncbi:hypothetical protein PAMP_023388 [Pampus punctatissimus]
MRSALLSTSVVVLDEGGGFTHPTPAVWDQSPQALRHTPHSWLSDTNGEMINTKETHGGSNIRGTKTKIEHQLHKKDLSNRRSQTAARRLKPWHHCADLIKPISGAPCVRVLVVRCGMWW